MANKRNLKRGITYVCSEIFAECVASALYSNQPDKDNVDAFLKSLLKTHSDYIRRVSHPEPGMTCKKYYNILKDSFNNEVNSMVDTIGNMHS